MNTKFSVAGVVHWKEQAHKYLVQGQYDLATNFYEKAIAAEPEMKSHYWHLGLLLLLQGQETEAQTTWLMGMVETEEQQISLLTIELLEVLETEAKRREELADYQVAWVIRNHIREINPSEINNLLQIIQLSIYCGTYKGEDLINLGVIEALQSEADIEVKSNLLIQILQNLLKVPQLSPEKQEFARVCLVYIQNSEEFADVAQKLKVMELIAKVYNRGKVEKAIANQLQAYQKSSQQERHKYYDRTRNYPVLRERFIEAKVPVEDRQIDLEDFEKWLEEFPEINQFYSGWSDVHIEKCLEHYLTYKFLDISKKDVHIDVAACSSIWANILIQHGIAAYRLDLTYPLGINGNQIGADAGNTKLPSGFASTMSLHCAYETFEGDADIRFIHEAKRVLTEKGRLAIIPLYTDKTYFIMSSPYADLSEIELDSGAIRVWRED
ncbi:MAG: hypothetical protein F6K17_34420, partial [Okeania sp. SIO3C4]|nr:hypothetical protein [Okeania sp. SIO3C4]